MDEPIYISAVRSEETLENFRMACRLTDLAFENIISSVYAGMTELDLLQKVNWAEQHVRKEFAPGSNSGLAFIIIESGVRTAMLHGRATDKYIEEGDFVTIDFGLYYEDAMADFTRTFVVGKADSQQRRIYSIVREAILECEACIKPGMTGREGDAIARSLITAEGYGVQFKHTLGHGFGDYRRKGVLTTDGISLAQDNSKTVLQEGMVFTIEPGIYIEGFGGVRIEDTVVMEKDGVTPLFSFTKDLLEINGAKEECPNAEYR